MKTAALWFAVAGLVLGIRASHADTGTRGPARELTLAEMAEATGAGCVCDGVTQHSCGTQGYTGFCTQCVAPAPYPPLNCAQYYVTYNSGLPYWWCNCVSQPTGKTCDFVMKVHCLSLYACKLKQREHKTCDVNFNECMEFSEGTLCAECYIDTLNPLFGLSQNSQECD